MQLLVRPPDSTRAESYGFHFLGFRTQRLTPQDRVEEDTGDRELGIVLLGGKCSVESSRTVWSQARASRGTVRQSWTNIGRRPNVFAGMPYALYLQIFTPRQRRNATWRSVTAAPSNIFPRAW
jgi:5-deoxy-D-glucuronate isomerase